MLLPYAGRDRPERAPCPGGNMWNSPPEQTSEKWLALKCNKCLATDSKKHWFSKWSLWIQWSGGCGGGFYKRFRQGRAPSLAGLCSQ